MLWFNEAKDHGFIEAETGERVYVHRSAFLEGRAPVGRCKGLPVEFSATEAEGGWVAAAASLVSERDQRRTTRHHSAGRIL